jgi:hypothetical protein
MHKDKMVKHFVTFVSPGTFFTEESTKDIPDWDINLAIEMSRNIKERYGATPFAFYFTTRERKWDDFDSKQTAKSHMYFLGGKIKTLEEVKAENNPDNRILISNMECNHWDKILVNDNSYHVTQPLQEGDIILQY